MPPSSHPVGKRHDGPDSRHHASLRSETDMSFEQISMIAWPLKAVVEDLVCYAGVRRRAPETEAKRINEPSTTPTGDQTFSFQYPFSGARWTFCSFNNKFRAVTTASERFRNCSAKSRSLTITSPVGYCW